MKKIILSRSIWMMLIIFIFKGTIAQPTFTAQLRNASQPTTKTFEFDIYLTCTSGDGTFEYASGQYGITVNAAIKNGGTITAGLVKADGTVITGNSTGTGVLSDLDFAHQPNSIIFTGPQNCIKLSAKPPSAGTIISTSGTRVARVRLTNTVDFTANSLPNLTWSFTVTPYNCAINAYVNGINTPVTGSTPYSNWTNETGNLPLNPPSGPPVYAVSGGGTICQGSTATVGLANSTLTYNYQLYKDAVAVGAPIPGTGAALSWTVGDAGVYTVMSGTTSMNGSASVIVNPVLTPSVSIVADHATVCEGTAINFTATPVNGGTNPTYVWNVNGVPTPGGATYQYNGISSFFDVFLEMSSNLGGCTPSTAVTSNTIHVVINPNPPAPVTLTPNVTACANQLPYTLIDTVLPGNQVFWYDAAIGGNLLASNSATYQAPVAGTFYNQAYNPVTGCWSVNRTPSVLMVNPVITHHEYASACDTYTWTRNGQTYTASGDYTYNDGCDVYILHLTITQSTTNDVTVSACDSYTWPINSQTYTQSGNYTDVNGCVTTILHLTITPSSTVEFTASACDSYTWALNGMTYTASGDYNYVDGCITNILHLTITPSSTVEVSDTACDSFTWALNGMTYSASGDYTYVVGCVTNILHLTINPNVVPLFPLTYGPYNVGDVPQALPTVSQNGVAGTWNPAVVSTVAVGSTVYTFTPAGGCASPITRTISVINPVLQFTFTQDIGTTLQASWPQVAGGNIYVIQYSLTPTGPWVGKAAYGSVVKIMNLTPNTTYYWRAYGYNAAGYQISSVPVTPYTTSTVSFENLQDIGSTTLLSWSDYSTWASNYVLQYKVAGAPAWTSVMTTINEKKLSGLTPLTSYDVRVGIYKGGVLWGTSAATTFTTGTVNYTVTNITGTSATLTWDATLTDVTTWTNASVINYRPVGSGVWLAKSVLSNANTANLVGLTPATNYEFIVYPYQASILWGPMKLGSFTTAPATKEVSTTNDVNIYPNPFTNQVSMSFFAEEATTITWNVYDMTGKVVLNGTESVTAGYSTLDIDGANLPTGVYTLNAVMNDKVENFRIIKQ